MHSDGVNGVSYAGLNLGGDSLWLWRWRRGATLGIVLSVGVGGTTVMQVAQRHDVTRQQVQAWRHALKTGLLSTLPEARFLPVGGNSPLELAMPTSAICAEAARPSRIELQLANGRCLRFDPARAAARLVQVIRAVAAA